MAVSRIQFRYPTLNSLGKLLQKRSTHRVSAMREDFLSVASHELKTPLTSLKLQVQLISRISKSQELESVSPEKLQHLAENADRQITRMTSLINSLLDASRMRSGKLELNPYPFDLVEAVHSEVIRFRKEAAFCHLQIQVTAKGPVIGQWDRTRIDQAVRTLLSNAATFGLSKPIEIQIVRNRSSARVSIRDFGMGISAQDRRRIFELFERGVPVANFGGLGLGLYIANQIALAHEGSLQVKSKLGEGSVFTLKLPLHQARPAAARADAAA